MATDVDFDQVEQMIEREQAQPRGSRSQDKRTSRPERASDAESARNSADESKKRRSRSSSYEGTDEDESRRRRHRTQTSSSRRSRREEEHREREGGGSEDEEDRGRRHRDRERRHRHRRREEEDVVEDDDRRNRRSSRRRSSRHRDRSSDRDRRPRTPRHRRSPEPPETEVPVEQERRRSSSRGRRSGGDRRPYLTFNGPGAPASAPHFSLEDEARRVAEQDDRRKREHDEARRDDMTVLVLNLCLKASEKDVWRFFSENAGKVRDIQVIRDGRSGKSKGVSYVEFYTQESVLKALALSGHAILGNIIKVQASQAEKNRQAKAAKLAAAEVAETGPARLFVGGLVGPLQHICEEELRQLFSPFGEVVCVEIQCDPYTMKSRGFGFVQFRRPQDAREAMSAMNGFVIGTSPIKVGYATGDLVSSQISPATDAAAGSASDTSSLVAAAVQQLQKSAQELEGQESERLDDEGGGLLSGPTRRIALMQKLQRASGDAPAALQQPHVFDSRNAIPQVGPAPSADLCLSNLYTKEEVEEEGPSVYDEITSDVSGECGKYGRVLQTFVNRKAADGRLWVRFASADESLRAMQALNGRWFGGNPIKVEFVSEQMWREALAASR